MTQAAIDAAAYLRQQCTTHKLPLPKVGIILGSGLSNLANQLTQSQPILYADIPQFPTCTVEGHSGKLHIGRFHDTPVACLNGRVHLYEGVSSDTIKTFIRTLKLMGCNTLIITNAAGSLNLDITTGELVLINDHINLQGSNPLVGDNDDRFGPRFPSMDDVYDFSLRQALLSIAQANDIPLTEGVFAGVLGPSFETPAEIRMLKALGADVIAMSLIPEVIVARHCGLRVVAISAISNLAAGLHHEPMSHEMTLKGAQKASQQLGCLITLAFESGLF